MNHAPKEPTEKSRWSLIPLTPEYLEAEHSEPFPVGVSV